MIIVGHWGWLLLSTWMQVLVMKEALRLDDGGGAADVLFE